MRETERNIQRLPGTPCRIIYSDIDGTLLDSSHHVRRDTREKLLELDRKGIPFILVSARMPDGVRLIQRELGICRPIICYSGGLILDEDQRVMFSRQIELGLGVRIKEALKEQCPGICCNTYSGNRWVVDDDQNPWVLREERITQGKSEAGDIKELFYREEGIHKFLLMGAPQDIIGAEAFLREYFPELSILKSNDNYLEVMDGAVKKSAGVHFLCRHYGIPEGEAAAFGDGENDLDMLLSVGYGYAMANALENVRRQAPFMTLSNDEEGILAVVREW